MTDILLYTAHVIVLAILGYIYRNDIIEGLKGDNSKWDAPELITGLWIVLFPLMVLADLFLNYKISVGTLASMDLILLTALGGRGLIDYINKSNDK